jgi:hypothetical protein
VGKPEGTRELERFRYRWKDNIKMDFPELGLSHRLDLIWTKIGTAGRLLCIR